MTNALNLIITRGRHFANCLLVKRGVSLLGRTGVGLLTTSYPMGYNMRMTIRETSCYKKWFSKLRDTVAKARILVRLRRVSLGNFGDSRELGEGVCELKFTFGPGYRIYYTMRKGEIVILLAGGDKSTQSKDIEKAKELARNI